MKLLTVLFISATILFLDAIWFSFTFPRIYSKTLSRVTRSEWSFRKTWGNLIAAGLAYVTLVCLCLISQTSTLQNTALRGFLLGTLTYACYNFTNLATFGTDAWGWVTALVDIPWGGIVVSVGSSAGFIASHSKISA